MSEISTKPYLIRAIYEWCSDQGYTPYLAVAVDGRTVVPRAYVQDGQIVLNVSMTATQNLQISNDLVSFQARFGGVAQNISVPISNVAAIYARENGHGMAFEVEPADADAGVEEAAVAPALQPQLAEVTDEDPDTPPPAAPKGGFGRGHLKVIK
jgi:stringent starvation protein B